MKHNLTKFNGFIKHSRSAVNLRNVISWTVKFRNSKILKPYLPGKFFSDCKLPDRICCGEKNDSYHELPDCKNPENILCTP